MSAPDTNLKPAPPGVEPPPAKRSALRTALAVVAVAACLPYGVLKLAWLTGSPVGLSDPDFLHSSAMSVANAGTFAMELVAAALAVLLARDIRWRLPWWSLVVPMFVGTGLLGGILLIVPVQLMTGGTERPESAAADPISTWVYAIVYTGFGLLGLSLLTLFAWHAWERWIAAWSTRLGDLPPTLVGQRAGVLALAAAMLATTTTELAVAAAAGIASSSQAVAITASLAATVAAGALVIRRPVGATARVPLLVGFTGCAVVASWGLYFAVILTVPNPLVGDVHTPLLLIVADYGRAVIGTLLAAALLSLRPATTSSTKVAVTS
jgi:hypothetical protein